MDVWNSGLGFCHWIWNLKFVVWNLEFGFSSFEDLCLEVGDWCVGFVILQFGISSFGVLSLVFRVQCFGF